MATANCADPLQRQIRATLDMLPAAEHYVVALSGGRDSVALLHALLAITQSDGPPITAVHVNHGLQSAAGDWVEFCTALCERWRVPFRHILLETDLPRGASVEAWARERRYAELEKLLQDGDMLQTGHHRDDQVETLLLQLLRGAGPQGLAAMPQQAQFGAGRLVRPLLAVDGATLGSYAQCHALKWVEDPSNADLRFDRNYLRHVVLPPVMARWTGARQSLGRAAMLQAQSAALLQALADQDLHAIKRGGELCVTALLELDLARRANTVRRWLSQSGVSPPAYRRLAQIIDGLCSNVGECGLVAWDDNEVRRYRDRLYLLKARPDYAGESLTWSPPAPLTLDTGRLRVNPTSGRGLSAQLCANAQLSVRFRTGGERALLPKRSHRSSLKKLFQAVAVPPWERNRIPLIYVDNHLAAVAGLWVFAPFVAEPSEPGWELLWQPDYYH